MKQKYALLLSLSLWASMVAQAAFAAPEASPARTPASATAEPAATSASVATPSASAAVTPASAPAIAVGPSDASNLRIIQARAATPNVAVYLDIRSESGKAVTDVKAEQLQADIGPYPASAKSFQALASTGEGIATIFFGGCFQVAQSRSICPNSQCADAMD